MGIMSRDDKFIQEYEEETKRFDFIYKYSLQGLEEFKDQDKDGTILFKEHLTKDIEICYWATKDYELESIDFMVWKDGDCIFNMELSADDSFKLRKIN